MKCKFQTMSCHRSYDALTPHDLLWYVTSSLRTSGMPLAFASVTPRVHNPHSPPIQMNLRIIFVQ